MYSLSGRSICVGNARMRATIKVVVRVNKSPSSPVAIFKSLNCFLDNWNSVTYNILFSSHTYWRSCEILRSRVIRFPSLDLFNLFSCKKKTMKQIKLFVPWDVDLYKWSKPPKKGKIMGVILVCPLLITGINKYRGLCCFNN